MSWKLRIDESETPLSSDDDVDMLDDDSTDTDLK